MSILVSKKAMTAIGIANLATISRVVLCFDIMVWEDRIGSWAGSKPSATPESRANSGIFPLRGMLRRSIPDPRRSGESELRRQKSLDNLVSTAQFDIFPDSNEPSDLHLKK